MRFFATSLVRMWTGQAGTYIFPSGFGSCFAFAKAGNFPSVLVAIFFDAVCRLAFASLLLRSFGMAFFETDMLHSSFYDACEKSGSRMWRFGDFPTDPINPLILFF